MGQPEFYGFTEGVCECDLSYQTFFSPKGTKLMENLAELACSCCIVHDALQQSSKFDLTVIITRMAYHLHPSYK